MGDPTGLIVPLDAPTGPRHETDAAMTAHATAQPSSSLLTSVRLGVSYLVGAVLVGSGLFHLGVFATLGGRWDGPVSWRKPATFGLSFGLTLFATSWVSSRLAFSPRRRAWVLGVFAADCVLEVTGIPLQAWRHVPSHFNNETPFDTVVAMSLAVGGAVLIATLGTLAVVALRTELDLGSGGVASSADGVTVLLRRRAHVSRCAE